MSLIELGQSRSIVCISKRINCKKMLCQFCTYKYWEKCMEEIETLVVDERLSTRGHRHFYFPGRLLPCTVPGVSDIVL